MSSAAPSKHINPSFSARTRVRMAGTAAAIGLVAGAVGVTVVADPAGAADVVHVSPSGDDAASGTAADPVRTISRAVQLADHGDTVEIESGVYHEEVQVYAKELHLRAAPGAQVVLDGARQVDGWSAAPGGWAAPWNTNFDRVEAPFTTPERPEAGWPEQFFLDGVPLVEVTSTDYLDPGEFFYDTAAGQVVIADDPTGHRIDGSDLSWGLYLNKANGSSVEGITVRRYATQTRNMAAIRAYADDVTITDVTAELNARIGVSAIGNRIDITNVRSSDNGHLGVHGHRSADLRLDGLTVTGNNRERFDAKHSAGGIKVTETDRLLVRSTVSSDNAGPGIWTDLDVTDSAIVSSIAERNGRSGIEVELSERIVVSDNIVAHNGEAGIWVLESSDVDVWHNTALRNVRDVWVEDGDRRDLAGVTVSNNVLGGGADGAQAILNVDDWTERRSAVDMQVSVDANLYWLDPSSPTQLVSRWANWPQPLALSADIEDHRQATEQAGTSTVVRSATNPFARSTDDVRQPASSSLAPPMPDHVAAVTAMSGVYPAGAVTWAGSLDGTPTRSSNGTSASPSRPATSGAEPPSSTGGAPEQQAPAERSPIPEGIERARIGRSSIDDATGSAESADPEAASPVPAELVEAADGPRVVFESTVEGVVAETATQPIRRAGWSAMHEQVTTALAAATTA